MKKYWIDYYKNFSNTYNLYWTDSQEKEAQLPETAERITRKEAIEKACYGRYLKKYNSSSAFANCYIFPADATEDQIYSYFTRNCPRGYIIEL